MSHFCLLFAAYAIVSNDKFLLSLSFVFNCVSRTALLYSFCLIPAGNLLTVNETPSPSMAVETSAQLLPDDCYTKDPCSSFSDPKNRCLPARSGSSAPYRCECLGVGWGTPIGELSCERLPSLYNNFQSTGYYDPYSSQLYQQGSSPAYPLNLGSLTNIGTSQAQGLTNSDEAFSAGFNQMISGLLPSYPVAPGSYTNGNLGNTIPLQQPYPVSSLPSPNSPSYSSSPSDQVPINPAFQYGYPQPQSTLYPGQAYTYIDSSQPFGGYPIPLSLLPQSMYPTAYPVTENVQNVAPYLNPSDIASGAASLDSDLQAIDAELPAPRRPRRPAGN